MIAISTTYIVSALRQLHVEKQNDNWVISVRVTETTAATEVPVQNLEIPSNDASSEDLISPSVGGGEAGSVRLRVAAGSGEALLPSAIYAQASSAVVCVQVESYSGGASYTGVIISEDGYVLSATEGLTNATSISVSFADGTQYPACRVGEERISGLCLLKIDASELPTVAFAEESALSVGQGVYCICNPYGTQIPNVFFSGMVAASGDVELGGNVYTVLQTTAQLNNVGYGCPILDSRGLVVGLTTPIGKRIVSGEDPCFAICVQDLTETIENFQKNAGADALWLGLDVAEIPEDYMYLFGFPGHIWIDEIAVWSSAYGVLHEYDVITEVDGIAINSVAEFEKLVSAHEPGDLVELKIYRSGKWYRAQLYVYAR